MNLAIRKLKIFPEGPSSQLEPSHTRQKLRKIGITLLPFFFTLWIDKGICLFFAIGLPRCDNIMTQCDAIWALDERIEKLIRKVLAMAADFNAGQEPRSIAAAVRHGRLGSAYAAAMIAIALMISICAIVLMISGDAALAAPRELFMVDDGSVGGGAIVMLIAASAIMMLLASVAFNGLTPSQARKRRAKR